MDGQDLEDPEKVSTIWVGDLNNILNKMNNTEFIDDWYEAKRCK